MGVEFIEETEVKTEEGKRIVMIYAGEKSFTLIQEKATAMPVIKPIQVNGEPVDLGYTVAAMTESSITWTHNGVDFYLASKDLTQEEMVSIARSVQGQAVK
jgi:hypothetical protein